MSNIRTPYTQTPVFKHENELEQNCFLKGREVLQSSWDHDLSKPDIFLSEEEYQKDCLEYIVVMLEGARALCIEANARGEEQLSSEYYDLYQNYKIQSYAI